MRGTKTKSEYKVLLSYVISYAIIALAVVLFPRSTDSFAWKVIISYTISFIGAIIVIWISQCRTVKNILTKRFHFSLASTVLSDAIQIDHTGSTARVYPKDKEYYVEGAISGFNNDANDPYIALCFYSFYELNTAEPYYECNDGSKKFIINMNDVRHIEVWPTVVENGEQSSTE